AGTGAVWLAAGPLGLDYVWMYLGAGAVAAVTALWAMAAFPQYKPKVEQNRKIVLRQRYWLFYALTFLSGARRQIFVVFAAFLLVEKFGYSVAEVAALFFLNGALNGLLAPMIGRLIGRWGERRALIFEYAGLVLVFTGYAFVESAWMAGALYVIDHLFFALAIAIKTYFQKIADPADLASSAGVSFTINHIAAVVIPVTFGLLWLVSPAAVFLSGAAMAAASLGFSFLMPRRPRPGRETTLQSAPVPAPAE
ncbi:MAG: MFS transporter, partial [Alphaproteobacteria bacterium]|nr:MFS transporter [Alphaproteobacteria bacterium]